MRVVDLAKVVGILPEDISPCFSELLFRLLFKADAINFSKLSSIFPIEAKMVERYRNIDGNIVDPENTKEGGYRLTDKGHIFVHCWKEIENG